MLRLVGVALLVYLCVGPIALGVPPQYAITALPVFGAESINNGGHVVGTYRFADEYHAFLYKDGTLTDLSTLGGANSDANHINDLGDIVGWSETATESRRAYIYSDGVMRDLGIPLSHATGINNRRQIVGGANGIAFLLDENGFKALGTLGGSGSDASAINDAGVIVGQAMTGASGDTVAHAFVYSGGEMADLGTLEDGRSSNAFDVNSYSVVVGNSDTPDGRYVGVDFGRMRPLRTLGGDGSYAWAVNDFDVIVGSAQDSNNVERAAMFIDYTPYDLNTLLAEDCGCFLTFADDINNVGQILASGMLEGQPRSFILTPVPEPSLVSSVLALLIVAMRRRT